MLGLRDIVWSLAICALLTLFFQCRPAWDARRFVERESRVGFLEAYSGHRFMNGEIIAPEGAGGARVNPMATAVMSRHLEVSAERSSWNGKKAELIVRHLIQLADGGPGGSDASQELRVRIEKQGGQWVYTLFEVRGHGAIDEPNTGNPWARALREAGSARPES